MNAAKPTLHALFVRLDRDKSGDIDRDEVKKHLLDLGIGKGLLGGTVLKKGVDLFMQKLDASGDDRVTWKELVIGGKHLLPPGVVGSDGKLDASLGASVFAAIAGASPKADIDAVKTFVSGKLSGSPLALVAGTISDSAAKLAVDALDADKDGAFTKDDLLAMIQDINAELAKI
jgi:Ca2+-binding EF-hand superfamily protein